MANVTDPEAVKFCNEVIRPLADRFIQLYYAAKTAQQSFTAKNLAGRLPNAADLIIDGSAQDGRTQITDGDVNLVLSYAGGLVTAMEASSNLEYNQLAKSAVNLRP